MYLVNRTRLPRDWKPEESLTWVDGLTLPGVFTREKVNLPARVTLARRWGNLPTQVALAAL